MSLLQQGIDKGFIKLDEEKKFITYVASARRYRYNDSEEKVRAECYLQLIFDYEYPVKRIDVELIVPRRTPSDLADIVVFEDDAKKKLYIIVECKKQIFNLDEIGNIIIPLPDTKKQHEIVEKAWSIRKQSLQISNEAQQQFNQTKKEIEQMILE